MNACVYGNKGRMTSLIVTSQRSINIMATEPLTMEMLKAAEVMLAFVQQYPLANLVPCCAI